MRALALFVFLAASPAYASEEVVVRLTVDQESPWVGQRVVLSLDVLGRDGWAKLDGDYRPKVGGAYVLPADTQSTRLDETIEGHSYSGQRYDLSVFAQRAGRIEIPETGLAVVVRVFGSDGTEKSFKQMAPSVRLMARLPAGVEDADTLVTSPRFNIEQSWGALSEPIQAGDVIDRRVVSTVDNASGMAIPPVPQNEVPGARVYFEEPILDDRRDRGRLTGKRSERISYVFESAGRIRLPDLLYQWWNPETESLRTILLEGKEVEVVSRAGVAAAVDDSFRSVALWWIGGAVGLMLVGLVIMPRLRVFWVSRLARWRDSETYLFRRMKVVARKGSALKTLEATFHWLNRLEPDAVPTRFDVFLGRWGGEGSSTLIEWLNSGAASRVGSDVPEDYVAVLGRARLNCKRATKQMREAARVLPELNEWR